MSILEAGPLTLRRFAAGSTVNGDWVEGASTDTTIRGLLRPLTGYALQQLDEGLRARGVAKVVTTSNLRGADQAGGTSPDHIVDADGTAWEVHQVQVSTGISFLPHTSAVVVRAVAA